MLPFINKNSLKRRRGVFTIEAALLIPLLFFLFLFFIDMVYLSYVKTSAKSKVELSILNSKRDMGDHKNKEFNEMKSPAKSLDAYLEEKLKRSILDEINLGINKNSFEKKAEKELFPAMQNKKAWADNIFVKRNSKLMNFSFKMNYNLHFKSFLKGFYDKFGLNINSLEGETEFKEHRIFDEIVSIDTVYYFVKESKLASELISSFKEGLEKVKTGK